MPTPASPIRVTSFGRRFIATSRYAARTSSSSSSRPTNASCKPPTPRGRISDSARTSRRAGTPSGFPFASTMKGSPNSNAPRTAPTVRSPTRADPGVAASSSRFATFTASPVTNELPSRGRPTTTSPVFTPILKETAPSKMASRRRCIESAACSARSA